MAEPYATPADLADRWRPLLSAETSKAATLLGDASYWLRRWFPARCAELDSGTEDITGAQIVVCSMVKRAMLNNDAAGLTATSQTDGPFNVSRTYSNPEGNLYVTSAERSEFVGTSAFASVRMVGL